MKVREKLNGLTYSFSYLSFMSRPTNSCGQIFHKHYSLLRISAQCSLGDRLLLLRLPGQPLAGFVRLLY